MNGHITFLEGAEYERCPDGSTQVGVENHEDFPVGAWIRLYVDAADIDEATRRLDCVPGDRSGLHAIADAIEADAESIATFASSAENAVRLIAFMMRRAAFGEVVA